MATPADEIRSQYLHRAYLLQSQVDNRHVGMQRSRQPAN